MVLMTATGRVFSWRKVGQEEPEDEDDDKGKRIKTSQTINLTKILRGTTISGTRRTCRRSF